MPARTSRGRRGLAMLRAHAQEAFAKVANARRGMKCARSTRGPKAMMCLSAYPITDMACGKNPINGLWACSGSGKPGIRY